MLWKIAEERIRKAMEEGAFQGLSLAGKPLDLEDDRWVPEDLRVAYRVLKNAGCVPPEVELRKEILSLKDLVAGMDDDGERLRKIRELNFKLMKLGEMRKRPLDLDGFPLYEQKIYERKMEENLP